MSVAGFEVAPDADVATGVDPVMMQVVKNALDSVAEQMAVTLQYTAHSTVIREILDFATALIDPAGRLITQSTAAPIFVNAMGPTLRFVIEHAAPIAEWEEGDVYLVNDPYLGGSQHLPDLVLFRPIFYRGRLAGIAGCVAHHVDVGGAAPGSYLMTATEIYQEGLRIPPVKLFSRGRLVKDIQKMLFANIRLPELVWGDLEAQMAAMQVGERGLIEIFDRFGADTVGACIDALLDYSERLMRHGIRKIPNGRYRFADRLDDDGVSDTPVEITLELTVNDDSLVADFTGSAPQRNAPINCSLAMTTAVVHYALTAAIGADVPVNDGCFRPVTVVAPPATVINASPPAPVVGRMATVHRTCDVVIGALAQALPEDMPAAYYGMSTTTMLHGMDDNDNLAWVLFEIGVGGWGGAFARDGLDTTSAHVHNPANTPIEMIERLHPVVIDRYELRADSGGAGRHRGGLGLIRDVRLTHGRARFTALADRMKFGPYGLAGGQPGGATELILNPGTPAERRLPSKISGVALKAGDVLSIRTPGGGGFGAPDTRERAAVAADLALGKISAAAAKEIYRCDPDRAGES
ncbi:MAG: hydantoinase B/oxoprolinase family protein [Alphaproteobacteria bacterium]|nr:hydantoinase B/oxoprolinase family protein [Alphaproteobacteria bacterium]